MSAIWTVARKEFRGYFQSSVALIFLAAFLVAILFSFFGASSFFARNLADVRPLFEWLPLLLIFLVAAITMRQWAEERKMGTLEILLTLPVSTFDMVIGKFLAGLGLVTLALALTLPLPIMVSMLGELDWGPVLGGYAGALLLGGAYLSIGLCVSSRTDNQVVALMLTLVVTSCLYFLGSESLTNFFGNQGSELLRALGTGSRFESVERGVLDLRDLAYYEGIAIFFLVLNWHFLELDRLDRHSPVGRASAGRLWIVTGLVGANVLALNLWLAPVYTARIDLTQRGEYSIDAVTKETLASLQEPLIIQGYFSARTHPLLSPLIPQLRDLLSEYVVYGGGKVQLEFSDPNTDEELQQELEAQYSIRSIPLRVVDRHQQAVVNSYFNVLLKYGDQFAVLGFEDLIDARADENDVDVRLRNPEYDLTRAIKRLSQDFQSIEAVFAQLPSQATLTAYMTPSQMPKDLAELPERIRQVSGDLASRAAGKLRFVEVDPSRDPALAEQLAEQGIRPLAADLFGRHTFYLDIALNAGGKTQRVLPRSNMNENDLRGAIEAAIRRATPGQLKTVGLLTEVPQAPPPNPQMPPQMQPPAPHPDYRILENVLSQEYQVERVDLNDGLVPDQLDVLIVGKTGALNQHQRFAIDQFLMQGGRVVALAGRYRVQPTQASLGTAPANVSLFELLDHYGAKVGENLVMDAQNAPFPVPVEDRRGRFRMQRIEMVPYPFFADIRREGFAPDNLALASLPNATFAWSSPIEVSASEAVTSEVLVQTSPQTWLNSTGEIQPNFQLFPEAGFGQGADQESRTVAVSLSGRFNSYFSDRASPVFGADGDEPPQEGAVADATGRTLKQSLPDAKLVVLGSSEFVSDLMMQIANSPGGEVHRSNPQLVKNLLDWMLEDTQLLAIRDTGAFARTLRPIQPEEARVWEFANYGFTLAALAVVAFVPRQRMRNTRPLIITAGSSR